jgi:hypothetical protein
MADLSAAIPKILSRGLVVLRQNVAAAQLVSRDFDDEAAQKGDTITVRKADTVSTRSVSPSNTPPTTSGVDQVSSDIALNNWEEAPFKLTDKEIEEAEDGIVPDTIDEAVKALAEQINSDVLDNYKHVYNTVGTAGATPFGSDYSEASAARKTLNNESVPTADRRVLIDPDAEENAINLSEFADASFTDDDSVIMEGEIGRKLGFDWAMDQQVKTHTAGSITNDPTVSGAHTAGATAVTLSTDADDEVHFNKGDLITFAGNSQVYAVREDLDLGNSASGDVKIEPDLQNDLSDGDAVSLNETTDHAANLAFHRNFAALAIRPIQDGPTPGSIIRTMTDPVTGIPLRLEVQRQWKQTVWSFDVLYGTGPLQPRLAVRLKG